MKQIFNIDEFVLTSFCVNTNKAFNSANNKFVLFKDLLHTFHDMEEIYEGSFFSYSAFITYSVISDSLIKNKNILSYEQYVYNVLDGYHTEKCKVKANPKDLAKIWTNIVFIFDKILGLSSNPEYSHIQPFVDLYTTFNHINSSPVQNNYTMSVPLVFEKDNSFDVLLIVPKLNSIYYNICLAFLFKYFKNTLNHIYVFEIDTKSISYNYYDIVVDSIYLNKMRKHTELLHIDSAKVSFTHCGFCPLTCNSTELLKTRYEIQPYKDNKRIIKTLNI